MGMAREIISEKPYVAWESHLSTRRLWISRSFWLALRVGSRISIETRTYSKVPILKAGTLNTSRPVRIPKPIRSASRNGIYISWVEKFSRPGSNGS